MKNEEFLYIRIADVGSDRLFLTDRFFRASLHIFRNVEDITRQRSVVLVIHRNSCEHFSLILAEFYILHFNRVAALLTFPILIFFILKIIFS